MMDNGKSIDDYWTPYGGGMDIKKTIDDIERRVGELENRVYELEPLTTKYPQLKKEVVHDEGKVYCDRDLCVNNDSCEECPAGDKPSPKVKKEKPCEHNWGTLYCMKCGTPNVDEITDTITIPRAVAEEWLKLVGHVSNPIDPTAHMVNAIKSALGWR